MKTFNVFNHPVQGFEAVKVGFSWPAFFFGSVWMLDKGLWGLAGLWFGVYSVVGVLESVADNAQGRADVAMFFLVIIAGLALIPGVNGNKWWEQKLLKGRYTRITTVDAPSPEAAIAQASKPRRDWSFFGRRAV